MLCELSSVDFIAGKRHSICFTENYLHIRFFIETNGMTFSSNDHEAYEAWYRGFLSFRKT